MILNIETDVCQEYPFFNIYQQYLLYIYFEIYLIKIA